VKFGFWLLAVSNWLFAPNKERYVSAMSSSSATPYYAFMAAVAAALTGRQLLVQIQRQKSYLAKSAAKAAMAKVSFLPDLPIGFDGYRVTNPLHLMNSLP
jgi:fermentation-respiration switch protein FrsA (DUF1100 family)